MRTHTINTYSFDELSEEAQQKVLEKYYYWNVSDSFWHECVIDDCKEIGKLIGIEIDDIYFSGFFNQGDGAQFIGEYSYAKGGLKALKEYAPHETEVHEIAQALQELQRKNFYALSAYVKHSGHYYHEYCTVIRVENENSYGYYPSEELIDSLSDLLRDFMRWIYKRLESEYDYLTSKESIKESLISNECQFAKDGKIYHG